MSGYNGSRGSFALYQACFYCGANGADSPLAAEDAAAKRECQLLEERFKQLRPEILDTLRRNEHAEAAFALAEDYQDFRNLAALCHKDTVYPPHQNPHAVRIQRYVDRFREAFIDELFQWYIEHGACPILAIIAYEASTYVFQESFVQCLHKKSGMVTT
jgi:nuclear pore complex protein Nup133